MAKSKGTKTRTKVPPIKAPARYVKGIGKKGQFEGGLVPTEIDPKYAPQGNNGLLTGRILGRQGQ